MAQADNEVAYTAPSRQVATPRSSPALSTSLDPTVFASLCDRVDAAEVANALNAIAKDTVRATKTGQITASQCDAIKRAVTAKRALIGKTQDAPSHPDDGPSYEREPREEG